jgi:phage I-like protein
MTTPFQLLQDDWIQIAPLGDHPHQLGIQRIDAAAVTAMANRFNCFSARLGRLFSGVPLFEGHHDTDPEKYPNGKSFAWVMELQDRAGDGLWGRVKWTNEGRAMVTSGNYKFISPVWNAREIARENGRPVFRPESLLSLALTNLPNLPLPPLANEQCNMNTITQILALPETATADEICAAVTTLKNSILSPQSSVLSPQSSVLATG